MSADQQRADCKFTTFELVPGNDPEQNICLLIGRYTYKGPTVHAYIEKELLEEDPKEIKTAL